MSLITETLAFLTPLPALGTAILCGFALTAISSESPASPEEKNTEAPSTPSKTPDPNLQPPM